MIELLVLAGFGVVTGVAWFLRRKGKDKAASDLELMRDALKLLSRGLLEKGEDKAVDFVMERLSLERVQHLGKLLGMGSFEQRAPAIVARAWLRSQLQHLVGKVEG